MMRQWSSLLIPSVLLVILVSCPAVNQGQERCLNATQNSDTGGSCTFDDGWCGWRNKEDNDLDWKKDPSGQTTYLYVTMWQIDGSQAKLISPLLCATGSQLHSFRFRYLVDKRNRCRLSLYLMVSGTLAGGTDSSSSSSNSQLLWRSRISVSSDSFISVGPLSFTCPGHDFQIMFVGEKRSNRLRNCKIDVSDVLYNNTGVIDFSSDVDECPAPPSTSPITATTTTTTTTTTKTTTVTKTSATGVATTMKARSSGTSSGTGSKHKGEDDDEGWLSSGAVAGIVVVVVVIVIVIVIIVVFLFVRRRKTGGWRWKGPLPTVVKIRRSVTHRTHYMLGAQRNPEIAILENHQHDQGRQERNLYPPDNTDNTAEPSAPPAPSSPVYINLTTTATTTTTTTTETSPSSTSHSPATNHHPHHSHPHPHRLQASAAVVAELRRKEEQRIPRYGPVYHHHQSSPSSASLGAAAAAAAAAADDDDGDGDDGGGGHDSRSQCMDAAGQGFASPPPPPPPRSPGEDVQYANCGDQPDDIGGSKKEEGEEEKEGQPYTMFLESSSSRAIEGRVTARETEAEGDDSYNHLGDDVHKPDSKERSRPLETSNTSGRGYTSLVKTGRGKSIDGDGVSGISSSSSDCTGEERPREGDYANEGTYANEYANEREGDHDGGNEYANCSTENQYSVARPVQSPEQEQMEEERGETGEGSYYYNSPRERPSAEPAAAADCEDYCSLAQHVDDCGGETREAQDSHHNPAAATQRTASDDNDALYSLAHHDIQGKGKQASASGQSETAQDLDSSVYSLAQHVTPTENTETPQNDDVNHSDVSNDYASVQRARQLQPKMEEQARGHGSNEDCYENVEKSPRNSDVGKTNKGDSYNMLDLTGRNNTRGTENSGTVGYYNVGRKEDRYDHLHLQGNPSHRGL